MQGATPLASPGELNPGGAGAGANHAPGGGLVSEVSGAAGVSGAQRGAAIPAACRPCRSGIRRGGLPSLSPAHPAFSFISFPYPPDPHPPWGRGRILVFLYKGLRPLHPPGLNPGGIGAGGEPRARWGGGDSGRLSTLQFRNPPGAESRRRGFNFGYSLPVGFAGTHRFKSIQIREKFWGVWGTLSRVPQRLSSVSPSPRLQRFSFSGRWCRLWYRPA